MNEVMRWQHLTVVIITVLFLAGCMSQPTKPLTTEQMLVDTTMLIENGAIALGQAVQLGTLDPASEEYARAYTVLLKARDLVGTAWDAYAVDDVGRAETSAQIAISMYMQIRPLFVQHLEVD